LRPLRVHLLILVLGAMLPGLVLTGVLVWRAFANNRALAERRLLDSARVDAAALDREFAGIIHVLEALATSPTLDTGDLAAFHAEARRIQSTQPGWFTIVLGSLDGEQLVSTRVPWGSALTSVIERGSFQRLIDTGEPTVGVIVPPPTGDTDFVFPVRVPVFREGELKYTLAAIVDIDSLTRVVPPLLPEEWTRSILDPQGLIAVRTRGAANFVGERAKEAFLQRLDRSPQTISSETTQEGAGVYAATSRNGYGWTSVVVVPHSVLDNALWSSMAAILAGGALLMISGLAAVLFVSRRLAGDLTAATTAAEAVAQGRPIKESRGHVAETRRLQQSLTSAASLLETRARERDAEIQRADAARAEAEQASQTKDHFLAVLGHELRNPLAPALTALELMKARDPQAFQKERQILERQVAHMIRLVNDLLDVSRLARGKVQLERQRFEIREAVDRAIDMASPLIVQRGHTFDVRVPDRGLAVDGDSARVVQVISNLLTNAAKYTPPGGRIVLTAKTAAGQVVLTCEDSGPGIPEELVARLFDPFAQGPRTIDRSEGGLGLGLTLARAFAEMHGGTIGYERLNERGSRFILKLPLAADGGAVRPAQAPSPVHRSERQRILLVDDNLDANEMLQSALEEAGHEVVTATNGPDAIAAASKAPPDVAVLDIGLPGMDGYELAGRLRAICPDARLIALTGYGQVSDRDAALAAGCDAHCAKPATISKLLAEIDRSVRVQPSTARPVS
jgi:signal transduction histidine kinase/ActR/RegA family two-component response regulator